MTADGALEGRTRLPRVRFREALALVTLALVTLLGLLGGGCQAGDSGPGSESTRPPLLVPAADEAVLAVEVRTESGEVLWRVEAESPRRLAIVYYGDVPEGFRQVQPADGSLPRGFAYLESLAVEVRTEKRLVLHRGPAEGSDQFTVTDWSMRWLSAPEQ